jgi:hypothetical protein
MRKVPSMNFYSAPKECGMRRRHWIPWVIVAFASGCTDQITQPVTLVPNAGPPVVSSPLELQSLYEFASDPYLMELVRELDDKSRSTALNALRDFIGGVMDTPASSLYHLESALLSLETGRRSPLEDPDGQIEDPEGRIALGALEVYRAWSHVIIFGVENQ